MTKQEGLIKELDDLGEVLYNKFGTDSYLERCTIHDLKAKIKALTIPVVGVEFTEKEVQAIEEKAYIAGYIRRAKMSNLITDEISEFHASRLYKNWKAFKNKP